MRLKASHFASPPPAHTVYEFHNPFVRLLAGVRLIHVCANKRACLICPPVDLLTLFAPFPHLQPAPRWAAGAAAAACHLFN